MNEQNHNNEKNRLMRWGRITLIVLAVFLAAQALHALRGLGNPEPVYNSISVTGEGEVVSIPDVASFTFAVEATAKTVSDAQAEVTKKMDSILSALKDLGIAEKDIKTTGYSVYPKYVYSAGICGPNYCPPSRQTLEGYTATHNVTVKVVDTENAGQALAVAGDNGATNVSSLSFTVEDEDALVNQARAKAIADARAKAKQLAKNLDVRLVRVIGFYENSGPRPMYESAVYGMGGDAMKSSSAPTLPTGENKTTVTVNVMYEIR